MIESHRRHQCMLALTIAFTLSAKAGWALKTSKNFYRIPYADNTVVQVTNDHNKHRPVGRIDMHGRLGTKPFRIVAAADGVIRFIQDGFSARQPRGSKPCNNNYVWIQHANGEWTKYTHFVKNSVTRKAKRKVGDKVKAGDYLGDEGKVGCASGTHLHFEVGVPQPKDPIQESGGFLKDNDGSNRNRIPRICGIPGGILRSGKGYVARPLPGKVPAGQSEIARHGKPLDDYQCLLENAAKAGYGPVSLDILVVGGKTLFNATFRPTGKASWRFFYGLSFAEYLKKVKDWQKGRGYSQKLVEKYRYKGRRRFAVVFKK